jgi:hypothetical protein
MAGPISIKRQASDYLKRSSQSSLCLVVIRRSSSARRERPRRRGAEKGDELVPFELIELHSVPAGRIAGYRTGRGQSGAIGTILQPAARCEFSPLSARMSPSAGSGYRPREQSVT